MYRIFTFLTLGAMLTIYHNPRCRKSREGLEVLEHSGQAFEVIKYLEHPLTKKELVRLVEALNISPIELVRTQEADWKTNFKGKELSNDAIIEAMVSNPKLIERPVVIKGNKAVIGRPIENIDKLL